MGDRALIHVTSSDEHPGPASAYVHWQGENALAILREARDKMREGDESYSLARLVGHIHQSIPGNLGLGVLEAPKSLPPSKDYSHGDAGVIVYNCSTGKARCYHGYWADEHPDEVDIGIPGPDTRG